MKVRTEGQSDQKKENKAKIFILHMSLKMYLAELFSPRMVRGRQTQTRGLEITMIRFKIRCEKIPMRREVKCYIRTYA